MRPRALSTALLALGLAAAAAPARGHTYLWIDDAGVTHATSDPAAVPPAARGRLVPEGDARAGLWREGLEGPPAPAVHDGTHAEADRARRLVRGALDDLGRGETARAAAALEAALALAPNLAEAHWYLALLEQARGHFDDAASHLRDFLATAGDGLDPWRASAGRRLAALSDEERLARPGSGAAPLARIAQEHPRFRIEVDPALLAGERDYLDTVLRYLEEARDHASAHLGVVPAEPTAVAFYGRAAYDRAYRHRFTFRTVGFFDGRVNVVSAAHPSGELRALLFHEITHALFRERAGGDRPYWLNEGLAELAGRAARSQPGLTATERETLRSAIDTGRWRPLSELSAGFAGLSDPEAREAYLESAAAAAWITARTDAASRARLLQRIGEGASASDALREAVGRDVAGVDAAVRAQIEAEFPKFSP